MSRRRRPFRAGVLASVLVVGALWACYGPTELVAEFTTDVDCATVGMNGIAIRTSAQVGQLPDATIATTSTDCTAAAGKNELGTLVLIPRDNNDDVVVEVVLGVTVPTDQCHPPAQVDGCIVARRRIGYVEHESLRIPIALDRSCLGIPCGVDETCDQARCVPARVQGCPGGVCSIEGPTAPGIDGSGSSTSSSSSGGSSTSSSGSGVSDATIPPDAPISDSGNQDASSSRRCVDSCVLYPSLAACQAACTAPTLCRAPNSACL